MARAVTYVGSITLIVVFMMYTSPVNGDIVKNHTKGYCVWYDQCTTGDKPKNCLYNGPAKNLTNPKGVQILNSLCPELRDQPTCCSTKQLQSLDNNLKMFIQLTGRCPACWNNMRRLYCQLTCSQDQSLFMDPTMVYPSIKQYILAVQYFVSPQFKQGLFDSCKDVTFPGNNEKVLSLLCGTTAELCTPDKLLGHMGDPNNGFAPFTLDFPDNLTSNLSWMNQTVFKCNQPFVNPQTNRTASVCSCQDCQSSCPVRPTVPPKVNPTKILGMDLLSFSLLVVYCFLLTCLVISFLYKLVLRKSYPTVPDQSQRYNSTYPPISGSLPLMVDSRPGCCEQLGSKLESFVTRWFTRWGVWCSSHPFYVIVGCILVVGILASGLFYFSVTTDPVELWSAPDSTARKQKELFDKKFKPFYRTEQLIISSRNPVPTGYHRYGDQKWVPFGPIFHLDLLNQALDLQNEITNMRVHYEDTNITLQDICFQPLAPQIQACTIQSVFQYFQNNKTRLNKCLTSLGHNCKDDPHDYRAADFHDHILACTESPTSENEPKLKEPCLGAYGGPVNPNIALGGFHNGAYQNATALIITFVVNNFKEKSKLSKAMAWEKQFLDFMHRYTHNKSNNNLTISYSAERSIQDELDRESNTDIFTILASYMIMFIYITIALGQFKSCDRILIDSKFTLGFSGILVVLFSVLSSVGFWSFVREPATLIIIEVVPFLVLAVGVDNIFILVQAYQRQDQHAEGDVPHKIGRVLGEVAPSMLLTSLSESVAFAIGAMSTMPAVRIFSLYAAAAVFFDFLLQVTAFVALMSLDAKHQENNCLDVLCCVKKPKDDSQDHMICFYTFMKNYFAEVLLSDYSRLTVVRF